MAGVEFDNAVGSGTGLYNDHQLFDARMNHASLVPVIGLMKAEDFGSSDSPNAPAKPSRSRMRGDSRRTGSTGKDQAPITSASPADVSLMGLQQQMSDLILPETTTLTGNSPAKSSPSPAASPAFRFDQQIVSKLTPDESDNQEERFDSISPLRSNGKLIDSEELELGSLVEVTVNGEARHGIIRWIGHLQQADPSDQRDGSGGGEEENQKRKPSAGVVTAGIELEEECAGCSDGTAGGIRYFSCGPRKSYFVPLHECRKDSRFCADARRCTTFGSIDCPSVTGDVAPLSSPEELQALCGKNRGIQGHHNSCYLDATLFAMFSCTTIFESLLYRPPTKNDIPEYQEVQRVLKEEIVNPLRANLYVRADRVMHLRTLLERLSSVRGLTSEEKDPEEFLNLILNQILKAEPYLKLSSGLESFFYQLFVEKDDKLALPSVQQLFDQSFLASDIKLRQVPPALLIQMPRFGRQFKMYPRIIPSLYLDITDVLENSPRQCCICGLLAEYECKQCFGQFGEGLDSTAFCA
jgi:ubiquitin thioesterase CYLD